MKRFRKILVGVDLSQGDRFVADQPSRPSQQAIEQAVWLAAQSGAEVCFCYCLDVNDHVWRACEEELAEGRTPNLIDEAQAALEHVVDSARRRGVAAEARVMHGKSWVELIRCVLGDDFDLVIVGTHGYRTLQRVLFGSTAMKLLRKCPCPVWVTRPQAQRQISSILVAHDLSPVGELALELGCSMAELNDARLHVLHSLVFPQDEYLSPPLVSAEHVAQRINAARSKLESQLRDNHFTGAAQVDVVSGEPSEVILDHLEKRGVELVVMGTLARSGIRGVITGNTAERLLPSIPCSVLAVKPADFVSPVAAAT